MSIHITPVFTPEQLDKLRDFEEAEPLPESWEVLRHNPHRLHIHNGEPCCVAGVDDCGSDAMHMGPAS